MAKPPVVTSRTTHYEPPRALLFISHIKSPGAQPFWIPAGAAGVLLGGSAVDPLLEVSNLGTFFPAPDLTVAGTGAFAPVGCEGTSGVGCRLFSGKSNMPTIKAACVTPPPEFEYD